MSTSPRPSVRLRPLEPDRDLPNALEWYRDPEVLRGSEGTTEPYDERVIRGMYSQLGDGGEVFVVEVEHEGTWISVGDAVLRPDTLPIVIGDPRFRSRGVGGEVLRLLIERATASGWKALNVRKVFDDNERSLRMYQAAGFVTVGTSLDGDGRTTIQLRLDLS
jgi:L-amino acid N-acyltransferase YncA